MIVYNLGCSNEHRFEGWFASADDYARQTQSKLLVCPMCGDERVSRLPHASYVSKGSAERAPSAQASKAPAAAPKKGSPQYYANLGAELLQTVMEKVLENTEDVGRAFPEEARKIHYKEAPERHIRGTASTKEVEALRDEGIEVVALPVPPHRMGKTH
ncbi:MAG TPA: DUF1178 family protein [Burkholderiales bacterium]|nr:DUF1178 family protein [Burkholderiales bacterium]